MKRREFIVFLGGIAVSPLTGHAQPSAISVVGLLSFTAPEKEPNLQTAFRQGLSESGFVEGKNVAIEDRWVDDRYDLLPSVLTALLRRQVAVMVVVTDPGALAAKRVTASVPIVFTIGGDPVAMGLVTSLRRPGGNFTGITGLNAALLPKKLELLHELVPAATNIAALVNPANPNAEILSRVMDDAAHSLGIELRILNASSARDFDRVFATVVAFRSGGLLIGGDPFFISQDEQLAALGLKHAVPTISNYREFATAGGLMSYGGRLADSYRLAGAYAGRILNGEKPADLPVIQATKVELVINLKTAKALGITIPQSLLLRADEVIQ